MEDFYITEIEFSDKELNKLIDCLKQSFYKKQESFSLLCYSVYNLAEKFNKMPTYKSKKGVVYNKLSFFKLFGFDHSQIYRYCECYEKFFVSNMCDVAQKMRPVFFAYSPSKLIELLSVSNEQLEKDIASGVLEASMTVKEIRQYVKRLKGETKGNAVYADNNPDVEDEEIPQAFDPTKYYEISYFENQSKQDLINICKIYQNKYVKKVVNDSI